MTTIYGIIGPSDAGEMAAMAGRLTHHGAPGPVWSPAPDVRFGRVGPGAAPALDGDRVLFAGHIVGGGGTAGQADGITPEALLIQALSLNGPDALAGIDGGFAVAAVDPSGRWLHLARDPYGLEPLSFARLGRGGIAFAGEYKALLALDDVIARPDPDAITHFLHTGYCRPDECFLADIRPIPPGHGITFGLDRPAPADRRRFALPGPCTSTRPPEAHAAGLEAALTDAVRRRLPPAGSPPTGPIGVSLSGGVDSAFMLAAIRACRPDADIHSFTVGHGEDDPEIEGARLAAAHMETHHHEVILSPRDLAAILPDAIAHVEDPIGNEEYPCLFAMGRVAAEHVDTLFIGNGSDTLFAGMPSHRVAHAAFARPRLRRGLEELMTAERSGIPPASRAGRLLLHARHGDHPPAAPPPVNGARHVVPPVSFTPEAPEPLTRMLHRSIADYDGRMGAQHMLFAGPGLSVRMPYWDRDVIRAAMEMPDGVKIHDGQGKHVLRSAAARRLLPPAIAWRRKGIQQLRHDRDFADMLDGLACDLLHPQALDHRGLFTRDQIDRLQAARRDVYASADAYRLWSVIVVEIWARLFVDARGARPAR
jgi:asparagine synthase (glutamine-hydrolysing)